MILKTITLQMRSQTNQMQKNKLNPHAPVAQKIADEVVFRRFQGEGVEFF